MKIMKKNNLILLILLLLNQLQGVAQSINLDLGLQAHYPFSGNADDISGNGNDGTTFGSPTLTTDRFGNANSAYEFDGIDDLINTYSTFDYPNRTLSLWINPYDLNGSGPSAHVAITQDDDALNNGILRVDFTNGEMKLWAGGVSGAYTNNSISINSWMHLVLIREGATSKYYLNNVLVHTSTADESGSTFNPVPDFIIGSGRSTINQFFEGKIDDIRIYDRAIKEYEIDSLFNQTYSTAQIEETSFYGLNVFPNPSSNMTHIECDSMQPYMIEIMDEMGRVIQSFSTEKNKTTINIMNYPTGIYYTRIHFNNEIAIKKLIKY